MVGERSPLKSIQVSLLRVIWDSCSLWTCCLTWAGTFSKALAHMSCHFGIALLTTSQAPCCTAL